MSTQLRDKAEALAQVLWQEHSVYRDRSGGVVIRAEHVRRWISLSPAGGRDELLVRAGRLLDGGTTAPARSEAIVSLAASQSELAAVCRTLLAEAAADTVPRTRDSRRRGSRSQEDLRDTPSRRGSGRGRNSGWRGRVRLWLAWGCLAALVSLYAYNAGMFAG